MCVRAMLLDIQLIFGESMHSAGVRHTDGSIMICRPRASPFVVKDEHVLNIRKLLCVLE